MADARCMYAVSRTRARGLPPRRRCACSPQEFRNNATTIISAGAALFCSLFLVLALQLCYGSRPTDGELDRVTDRHSRSLPATHIANDEIRGQVESVGGRACGASKFYRPRRRVRVRCGCILCRKPTQARPQARPSTTGHDLLSYKRFVTTTTHSYM